MHWHKNLQEPKPVINLIAKVSQTSDALKREIWRCYRYLRKCFKNRPAEPEHCAWQLLRAVNQGALYNSASTAMKLANEYTAQLLCAKGTEYRPLRALAREFFHLVRLHLRDFLGYRSFSPEPWWSLTGELCYSGWRAVCDGSQKALKSSAGILVYSPENTLVAEVSLQLQATTSVQAELHAVINTLRTLIGLNAKNASIEVDSLAVICAFERRLHKRYTSEAAEIQELIKSFTNLDVRLVSRLRTHRADRLASQLSDN